MPSRWPKRVSALAIPPRAAQATHLARRGEQRRGLRLDERVVVVLGERERVERRELPHLPERQRVRRRR